MKDLEIEKYNKKLQDFYNSLSNDIYAKKGADHQKNRVTDLMYRSRLKFSNKYVFRIATNGKKIKIFFYPHGLDSDLKINSNKRASHVREFYYQDNINLISDKVFLKRLISSCNDLLEIDNSY